METMRSTSGFKSETSLSGNIPHTPPYTPSTPNRTKRRLERADSNASIRSIQPTETSSPAKKAARLHLDDEVKVEELTEGDAGYITDIEVVYPQELEEVETHSDIVREDADVSESDTGISDRLSRLDCDDSVEAEFEKKRREKHLRKRTNSRVFKRTHSQSAKDENEATDSDAMGDHDLYSSARRLRRRVRGPTEGKVLFDDAPRSSPEPGRLGAAVEIGQRQHKSEREADDNKMDVDPK